MKPLPWPVTIVRSRYGGCYEGAPWLAFNLDPNQIPEDWNGGDTECSEFFFKTDLPIGRGASPDGAIEDLDRRLGPEQFRI